LPYWRFCACDLLKAKKNPILDQSKGRKGKKKSEMGFMEYVKSIEWEHESYPGYEDCIVLPLFALFFPFVRFFLDRFVFQVLCLKHSSIVFVSF